MSIGLPAAGGDLSIRADETVMADDGGRKIMKGNVRIELGAFSFEADKVVQYLADDAAYKYEAAGSPIVLQQQGDALAGLERGTAATLEYRVPEKTLLLTDYELRLGDGSVQRGGELKLVLE